MTPYSPLEVAGRDIYIREGCYLCHSQMVRPMRAEILRYGPNGPERPEYQYDRPFLLGSRRLGPDLQRQWWQKYPDAWHYEHMRDPRSTSPEFGDATVRVAAHVDKIDPADVGKLRCAPSRGLGTPYTATDDASVDGIASISRVRRSIASLARPRTASPPSGTTRSSR